MADLKIKTIEKKSFFFHFSGKESSKNENDFVVVCAVAIDAKNTW